MIHGLNRSHEFVMSVLFTFAGQGAQRPGMLHALPGHSEVLRTLREAREVLGHDPLQLDDSAALKSTRAVQLCLLLAGVAMARVLIARDAAPDMVAGLSIGAYPAAVIAGALDFADAVHLVVLRGTLMERAYPVGYGMAAIVGLDRIQVEALIARFHGPDTPVYLANLNALRQIVIAGAEPALDALLQQAREGGAQRAERLAVAVPAHCALFEPAADALQAAFQSVTLHVPRLPFLGSSAARVLRSPGHIAKELARNMAQIVYWSDTMRLAWELGARLVLEMSTGSVLTRLATPLYGSGNVFSCDGPLASDQPDAMEVQLDTLVTRVRREQ